MLFDQTVVIKFEWYELESLITELTHDIWPACVIVKSVKLDTYSVMQVNKRFTFQHLMENFKSHVQT